MQTVPGIADLSETELDQLALSLLYEAVSALTKLADAQTRLADVGEKALAVQEKAISELGGLGGPKADPLAEPPL